MRCSSCSTDNPQGMKFCGNCAAPLKGRCARCGFENPPAFKFCGECAAPLDAAPGAGAADPPPVAREPGLTVRITPEQPAGDLLDGERKTVTALFADIKGSTELMEKWLISLPWATRKHGIAPGFERRRGRSTAQRNGLCKGGRALP
jgi:double zinc ribbon protein